MSDETKAATEAAPIAVAAAPAAPHPSEAVVDEWVARFVHNSPVSRSTEAMNHLTLVAIPALKTALKG